MINPEVFYNYYQMLYSQQPFRDMQGIEAIRISSKPSDEFLKRLMAMRNTEGRRLLGVYYNTPEDLNKFYIWVSAPEYLFHEIGHHIFRFLPREEKERWINWFAHSTRFPSQVAEQSVKEFFSELYSAYRNPKTRDLVKERFNDMYKWFLKYDKIEEKEGKNEQK